MRYSCSTLRRDFVLLIAGALKQYLAAEHLVITTIPSVQNIPDKQLAALGVKRRSSVRMPYFGAALACLTGTELILTLTNGMREMVERNSTLRLVKAPQELHPFHFLTIWHPRLTADARHTWLREAIRQVSPRAVSGQLL
jgi:hypothetical protein